MANTTVFKGTTITITPDGSTDWNWQTESNIPVELRSADAVIESIQMHPGAQSEEVVVRDSDVAGEIFCRLYSPEATPTDKIRQWRRPKRVKPFISSSDCTWSSSTRIIIELL